MRMGRRELLAGAAAAATAPWPGHAQDHQDTILTVSELGPNSLDSDLAGANRSVYEVTWNCYDRLVTYGVGKATDGDYDTWDYGSMQPALAEEWTQTPHAITFKLRRDAVFHDGSPVTAEDVRWSFARRLGVGGYPKFQFSSFSMSKPEQFVAVDDHTFRIDFDRPDNYALPYLATPVGFVLNSKLVRGKATGQDPWGLAYTRNAIAGSGAYKVANFVSGQSVAFTRNDAWVCGKRPAVTRVLWRAVPSAGTRRAMLEHGDIDISFDLPPQDVADLAKAPDLRVVSAPMQNTVQFLAMNVTMKPFDNPKLRQAIAAAIPYQQILDTVLFGRAKLLDGGSGEFSSTDWPQPLGYKTDLPRAKQLMAEAGLTDGFDTTLSFDLGAAAVNEPMALLIQENLRNIGIRVTINKVPGANWRTEFGSKKLPMLLNVFGGWLPPTYFYFAYVYYSADSIFNTADYKDKAMDALIDQAHFTTDPAVEHKASLEMIQKAEVDLPNIPIYQPFYSVALRRNVTGYTYWFFRQLDYTRLVKT
jgi:peptide/nickel transport system substrate-binding protein